jgi:hypothetical protein
MERNMHIEKALLTTTIAVAMLSDVTSLLETMELPKTEWYEYIIESIILMLERGEAITKKPLLKMLKEAIEAREKEIQNGKETSTSL